jgi:hypothetical protein
MYICVDVGARVQPGGDGGGAGADRMSAREDEDGGQGGGDSEDRTSMSARVCVCERE